jgi:phosphoserine phosphatase RsbU/P
MTTKVAGRKTIAVLVDFMNLFARGFELEYRELFEAVAEARDLNIIYVYGRAISNADRGYSAHNRIYELLGPQSVDGIITLSSSISSFCGAYGMSEFFKRLESLPRCSVGMAIPTVPSIEVDNLTGMEQLLEHLLGYHGYQKVAFLRGPEENVEANIRFEAYFRALRKFGIAYDSNLVEVGGFSRRGAKVALERIIARSGKPDAVIAANDSMALGALTALRSYGFRVPRDAAVTGFDDLILARLGDPPLTTVAQPIRNMVELAVELVVKQILQEPVPELTSLSSRFVTRESCGCKNDEFSCASVAGEKQSESSPRHIVERAVELRHDVEVRGKGVVNAKVSDADRLIEALEKEFSGKSNSFIREVEDLVENFDARDDRFQQLQGVMTWLRGKFASVASTELEDLWQEARLLVAFTHARRLEQQRFNDDDAYHRIMDNGEHFRAALDLPTLTTALSKALQSLGMNHAYVSRYGEHDQRELECFLAIRDGQAFQPINPRFPAEELMPRGAYRPERRSSFLLFPLAFDTQNLGVVVFELLANVGGGYQIVRDQISAALRSINLHQEILQKTTLHERLIQEQERQATAKRIHSLSVLAGGVAHDLNNVLGPLVALPDLIIEQINALLPKDETSVGELHLDISTIKTAALRATQTIKDLLTLGRQGQTQKECLELNDVVARCLTADAIRLKHAKAQIALALSSDSLFVIASESHLTRAVTNLVRNAIEAIDEEGRVLVETGTVEIREPMSGYELIDPGSYALLSVSDNGRGIVGHEIGRLFEPFFSSKRLTDQSGSGLGLAIVHAVVKEHGGFINVESKVGVGTKFTLYIPRSRDGNVRSLKASDAPRGNARILVVDDEPVQLRTCRRVLSHLGYQVDTMSSGREVIELFTKTKSNEVAGVSSEPVASPYDLVILDMLLDEEDDGVTLFTKIQALYPLQKGIIASGHAPSQRVEQAMNNGLAWLAKPYTRAALARAVRSVLDASGQSSSHLKA